jgi:hypothetical protein
VRKIILAGLAIASAIVPLVPADAGGAAAAADDFPLSGTYTQNVPCKGDARDQAALKVTISPQQIVSNVGVCMILEKRPAGKSYKLHVECKFPAGPLVGDLTFTPQPNHTIKFVDRNNTYNAVLYRCRG